jgi:hypothetical protein
MPCRYYETEEERMTPFFDRLNKLTRIACELANRIEKTDTISELRKFSKETVEWWNQHKEQDAIKTKQDKERLRSEALAKLSKAERNALGFS